MRDIFSWYGIIVDFKNHRFQSVLTLANHPPPIAVNESLLDDK